MPAPPSNKRMQSIVVLLWIMKPLSLCMDGGRWCWWRETEATSSHMCKASAARLRPSAPTALAFGMSSRRLLKPQACLEPNRFYPPISLVLLSNNLCIDMLSHKTLQVGMWMLATCHLLLEDQVGGKHYRSMKIQPAEFINENKLLFAEGNAIKYICRHQSKGKEEDIKKAIHYLEMIIERDYNV